MLKCIINSVENSMASTNEKFEQVEKDMNDAPEELQSKSKIFHKVEAKLNADEDELKRCSILTEGIPEKVKQTPRKMATNLLKELGINFVESDIRLSNSSIQNNQKRARAIKIKFSATYF